MTADLNIALGAMEFGTRIDEATSRAAQLSEALDGARLTLTDDQRAALDDAW